MVMATCGKVDKLQLTMPTVLQVSLYQALPLTVDKKEKKLG